MPAGTEGFWGAGSGEILSVGDLLGMARQVVEGALSWVWIEGEAGNVRIPSSGHAYFTLGDDRAQIRAVCFRSTLRLLTPELLGEFRNGLHVIARGRLTVYEARGDLQLVVEDMELQGAGLARLALEARKRKLAAEGLFDPSRKRRPPTLPRGVGVVASVTGAALQDVLRVLERRAPGVHVYVARSTVQGERAVAELVAGLGLAASHPEVDVVILVRGGGSSEDLSAFNEEAVVRAVGRCRVPVISGVGHETDLTLVDLAADLRASTPSAAAELAVREWGHWVERVAQTEKDLAAAFRRNLAELRRRTERADPARHPPATRVARLRVGLDRRAEALEAAVGEVFIEKRSQLRGLQARLYCRAPVSWVAKSAARLTALEGRLIQAARSVLAVRRRVLDLRRAQLEALSPVSVLGRGYSIARRTSGEIVRDALQCAPGEDVSVTLARGVLGCRVSSIHSGRGGA